MPTFKTALTRATLGAALVASLGVVQAASLINGSFEDAAANNTAPSAIQTFSLGIGSTAMAGWTVIGDVTAWIGGPQFGLTASAGNKFLDLTNYQGGPPFGGVEQTVGTLAGTTYTLSFDLGSSSTYLTPSAIAASVFLVDVGTLTQTFTSTATGVNNWQSYTMNFTAANPFTTIRLLGTTGTDYIGLDNVALSVTAVPEPGTWAMMLAGMAAVGSVAARRRVQRCI